MLRREEQRRRERRPSGEKLRDERGRGGKPRPNISAGGRRRSRRRWRKSFSAPLQATTSLGTLCSSVTTRATLSAPADSLVPSTLARRRAGLTDRRGRNLTPGGSDYDILHLNSTLCFFCLSAGQVPLSFSI